MQVRRIRAKMVELITNDVAKSDLKGVVSKLLPDAIAKDIEKACQGIYPLHDVYIRKVPNPLIFPFVHRCTKSKLTKLCFKILKLCNKSGFSSHFNNQFDADFFDFYLFFFYFSFLLRRSRYWKSHVSSWANFWSSTVTVAVARAEKAASPARRSTGPRVTNHLYRNPFKSIKTRNTFKNKKMKKKKLQVPRLRLFFFIVPKTLWSNIEFHFSQNVYWIHKLVFSSKNYSTPSDWREQKVFQKHQSNNLGLRDPENCAIKKNKTFFLFFFTC